MNVMIVTPAMPEKTRESVDAAGRRMCVYGGYTTVTGGQTGSTRTGIIQSSL